MEVLNQVPRQLPSRMLLVFFLLECDDELQTLKKLWRVDSDLWLLVSPASSQYRDYKVNFPPWCSYSLSNRIYQRIDLPEPGSEPGSEPGCGFECSCVSLRSDQSKAVPLMFKDRLPSLELRYAV